MKRLSLKILITCIVVLVLYIPVNILYLNSDFFSENFVDATRFDSVPNNLQVVNLGTSHGLQAFDYSEFPEINAWNLANKDQMFKYDLQFLKQYSSNIDPGATVLIPVSYMSFTNPTKSHAERAKVRNYRILKPKYILDFNISDWFLYKTFPVLTVDWELMFIFKDYPPSVNKTTKYLSNSTMDELTRSVQDNYNFYFSKYCYSTESFSYLKKLVEYCIANKYKPILVGTPVIDLYTKTCPTEILEHYYQNTSLITAQYDIPFLDYTHSDLFCSDYSYFIDTSHMQTEGAKLFTETILRDIGIVK